MKVLKNATTEWKQEVKCSGCASVLEVDMHDIDAVYAWGEWNYRITCPLCRTKTKLSSQGIPPHVRETVRQLAAQRGGRGD